MTTVSTVDPIKLVFSVSEKDYLEFADRLTTMLAQPLDQRPATGELIRADGKIHPYKGRFLATDRIASSGWIVPPDHHDDWVLKNPGRNPLQYCDLCQVA